MELLEQNLATHQFLIANKVRFFAINQRAKMPKIQLSQLKSQCFGEWGLNGPKMKFFTDDVEHRFVIIASTCNSRPNL